MPAVTAAELTRADTGLGAGEIALLHTGWTDRMYGTFPTYFTQSPYLELEAARWLTARRPSAVVFDFFEEYMARLPDFTSEAFTVHPELLGNGVVIVEGATNLGALKGAREIQFFAPFFKVAAPRARQPGCSRSLLNEQRGSADHRALPEQLVRLFGLLQSEGARHDRPNVTATDQLQRIRNLLPSDIPRTDTSRSPFSIHNGSTVKRESRWTPRMASRPPGASAAKPADKVSGLATKSTTTSTPRPSIRQLARLRINGSRERVDAFIGAGILCRRQSGLTPICRQDASACKPCKLEHVYTHAAGGSDHRTSSSGRIRTCRVSFIWGSDCVADDCHFFAMGIVW